MSETIHASCVALNGRAVLITGKSGAGKSDLALRLIDRGAVLVSDDYTRLEAVQNMLLASPPETIAGQIEVRGLGILRMPHVEAVPVALLISSDETPERLPEPAVRAISGIEVPMVALRLTDPSTPIKVALALEQVALEQVK